MENNYCEGFVRRDHAVLHYHSYGSGKPFLMLHGNMQSEKLFEKQVDFFQNRFRVITIDSRGHGQSSYGEKRLSVGVIADDVLAIMDVLNIDKAILLGFSDGGNVALKLAAKAPDRVDALVVIGANTQTLGLKSFVRIPVKAAYHIARLCDFIPFFDKLEQKLHLIANKPDINTNELRRIFARALFITGQFDIVKERHTRYMAEQANHSTIEIVKGARHNVLKQKPDTVNMLIENFLAQTKTE